MKGRQSLAVMMLVLGAGIVVVAATIALGNKPGPEPAPPVEIPPQADSGTDQAPADNALRISADELERRYEANEVATDRYIDGRPLLVTGRVAEIRKDFTDTPVIELGTADGIPAAARLVDGQEEKAAELAKGDRVLLRCERSMLVIGIPQLRECSLISP